MKIEERVVDGVTVIDVSGRMKNIGTARARTWQ